MSSKASFLVISLSIILVITIDHASALPPTQPNYLIAFCESEFGNYTSNSAYNINLNTVLTTLLIKSSASAKFYSTDAGIGAETVYGQYYCRGDISTDLCGACVLEATKAALVQCPQSKASIVWYQECTLHYKNQPLFGVDLLNLDIHVQSGANETDPGFFPVLNSTMVDVASRAINSPGRFATGEGVVSANETVYCLVQCSPDLNMTQCDKCIELAAKVTSTCCGNWPSVIYTFLPSCQMMYNTFGAFYFTPNAPPSSSPPASLEFTLNSVRIPSP